jgi:hypothetical protein
MFRAKQRPYPSSGSLPAYPSTRAWGLACLGRLALPLAQVALRGTATIVGKMIWVSTRAWLRRRENIHIRCRILIHVAELNLGDVMRTFIEARASRKAAVLSPTSFVAFERHEKLDLPPGSAFSFFLHARPRGSSRAREVQTLG